MHDPSWQGQPIFGAQPRVKAPEQACSGIYFGDILRYAVSGMKDVVFECPKCNQLLEAPEDMVEMYVECPNCGKVIQVPSGSPAKPAAAKAAPEDKQESEADDKSSTIRIELPPDLGIPKPPKRKITIRRNT